MATFFFETITAEQAKNLVQQWLDRSRDRTSYELKVAELAPEGSRVEPGALLVRFDDAPFRGELEAAQLALAAIRAAAARVP